MKKTLSLFTTLGLGIASLHAQEQAQTDSIPAKRSSLLLYEPARAKTFQQTMEMVHHRQKQILMTLVF